MPYAALVASDAYRSKHSGSGLEVVLAREDDPTQLVIGATTGINFNEDFETVPVEEAGNDGVDEHVQGRHSGTLSIPAFWTPEWNDTLPTRSDFIGHRYTAIERIAVGRPGAGTVTNVATGLTLSRLGQSFGARGAKTLDLAFSFVRRYKGQEWATLTGT